MNKKVKITLYTLLCLAALLSFIIYIMSNNIAVLNPKGEIATKQRDLIFASTLLMLIVVVPVLIMSVIFAWKYRASNKSAKYEPNWGHSYLAEAIWWGFPCLIIIVLSILTYKSSHELDPFKPIESKAKPLKVQVVALQWKWLFIYPEQNIATINYLQFPVDVPLDFEITADAPMNSFWIPQLGGQIYAMPGMKSKLHLIANEIGSYRGSSANLSGTGFAGMVFTAKASTQQEFEAWVQSAKSSSTTLTKQTYQQLVAPTSYDPVVLYSSVDQGLFEQIVMQYSMSPSQPTTPANADRPHPQEKLCSEN